MSGHPTISAVFGTSRQLPLSYVPRPREQEELGAALDGDGHIVVWGEPSQGKSSLLRYALRNAKYSVIECRYAQAQHDVYGMLLREAGASVAVERKKRRTRGIGARVSFLSGKLGNETETTEQSFEIDIANVTDVLRVLGQSNLGKFVILDNFHRLGRPVQRGIIEDLKTIYEKSSLRLIIVGIWADRDQLRGLHIDLGGRVDSIEVARWTDDELGQVIDKGEALLPARFDEPARRELIAMARQSVGLLQELANKACHEAAYASAGLEANKPIGVAHVDRAIHRILHHSSGRMRWYVSNFAKHRGQPHKGILHALLTASDDDLKDGIPVTRLLQQMLRLYPFEVANYDPDDLIRALSLLGPLHRSLQVRPVLEYDAVGGRLHVVDPLARLYWTSPDRDSLIDYLPDQGRDLELESGKVRQADFESNVLKTFGSGCAVCPVTSQDMIQVVRLAYPRWSQGHGDTPEFGLPLCRNHVYAWKRDLLAFEPETTAVVCVDPVESNVTRNDLTHLPVRPARAALDYAWRHSGWRLSAIWAARS